MIYQMKLHCGCYKVNNTPERHISEVALSVISEVRVSIASQNIPGEEPAPVVSRCYEVSKTSCDGMSQAVECLLLSPHHPKGSGPGASNSRPPIRKGQLRSGEAGGLLTSGGVWPQLQVSPLDRPTHYLLGLISSPSLPPPHLPHLPTPQ